MPGSPSLEIDPFAPWLRAWGLVPDGASFQTEYTASRLLPVRKDGLACMLKIATADEEVRGGALMEWWAGQGAAPVIARDGPALLLERAISPEGLSSMAKRGADPEALAILCDALAALHRPRRAAPPLPPLAVWFRDLNAMAGVDPRLAEAAALGRELLATTHDQVVLHGDMHHENLLDFGPRGWLAIDPKGLMGERACDYANIFRNPDQETALAPSRMQARLHQVSEAASLAPDRLLRWVAAHAGLSAAWSLMDGKSPAWSFAILDAANTRLASA